MSKLMARVAVAFALVGLAVPAFPCDAMKQTTASAPQASEKKPEAKPDVAKTEKKSEKTDSKSTVASNQQQKK